MDFSTAQKTVMDLKVTPADNERLKVYALFKQATVGDVNTERPGMLDFKGKSKWDAWEQQKGKACSDAEKEYIEFVEKLVESYGV